MASEFDKLVNVKKYTTSKITFYYVNVRYSLFSFNFLHKKQM